MPHDAALRATALIRHNTVLMLREPGPLASRMIMPLAFLVLLHPLYEAAQGQRGGTAQAVIATLITFSLLALSIVGGSILTDRSWHTWERIRATAVHPAELLAGKALPVLAALLAQQALIIAFGVLVLGLTVAALPLLMLALLAWTLTLLGLGAMLGVLARSLAELSAAYDIGAMLLSSLGGALVPLAVAAGLGPARGPGLARLLGRERAGRGVPRRRRADAGGLGRAGRVRRRGGPGHHAAGQPRLGPLRSPVSPAARPPARPRRPRPRAAACGR